MWAEEATTTLEVSTARARGAMAARAHAVAVARRPRRSMGGGGRRGGGVWRREGGGRGNCRRGAAKAFVDVVVVLNALNVVVSSDARINATR